MAAGNSEEIIECFSLFQSNLLKGQWLDDIWESGVFEIDSIPSDYEDVHNDTNWASVLRDATNSIRCQGMVYISGDSCSSDTESIIQLLDKKVCLKGIVVLTFYFVGRGIKSGLGSHKSRPTYSDRQVSIFAASLYLCLVALPGSNAFRLFHPVLFEKTFLLFENMDFIFQESEGMKSIPSRKSKQGRRIENASTSQKRKGTDRNNKKLPAKRSRKNHDTDLDDLQEDVTDEDRDLDVSDYYVMSRQESQSLIKQFCSLLKDISCFLSKYSLKNSVHSVESTARHLSDLLALENSKNHNVNPLVTECLIALRKLCEPLHGSVDSLVCIVLKHLLPIILIGQSKMVPNFVTHLAVDVPNEEALLGIRTLVQHLCFKVHEKADARGKLAIVIVSILDKLPIVAYAKMVEWLLRFSQMAKVVHRLFALELFSLLLGRSTNRIVNDIESVPEDLRVYLSDVSLLKLVFDRCSDKASGVRTKALSIVASSAICAEPNLHSIMLKILTPSTTTTKRVSSIQNVTKQNQDSFDNTDEQPNTDLLRCHNPTIECETTLLDYDSVIRLVTSRTMDTKVQVRRAALQLLQSIMELSTDSISAGTVKILRDHCLDVSLLVRKQSMHSLTHLVQRYSQNDILHEAWLAGVLPSIVDCESTCQAKCLEAVEEVIIQNIVPYHKSLETFHKMAWSILKKVVMSQRKEQWRYLRRSLVVLSRTGKIKPNIMVSIQTHIDTDNNAAAWMLLSGLASHVPVKNHEFVMVYWDNHQSTASDNILRYVLMVIEVVTRQFKAQTADVVEKLATVLLNSIRAPMVINQIVTTMSVLCQLGDGSDTTLEDMFKNYCKLIMKHCDKYLASVIFRKTSLSADVNENCMIHNLFTVGELGLHCPEHIPKRILLILKSFLASPTVAGCRFDELRDSLPIKSSQPLDLFTGSRFGKPVRGIAFISLGKICLQLQSLAKECVPAFGRELEMSDDPIIRNNVVVIMADLCKRYTTMVDEYIPAVNACLRDPALIVRRQALTLLTNLLQEDYLKWRGPLFFHYLSTLVDESDEIRSFGEYGLLHILNKRHPDMFQQHFIECLFHFNAYKDHEKYNKVIQSEKEVQLFSMAGDALRDKRSQLYKFMLENMHDEHRFQITTKICQDVLGGIVDGSVKLTTANGATCVSGQQLLRDGLAVLSSDAIKLATLRSSQQDDLDDGDVASAVVATAKKTIITQVVKKNAIENIIPIVVSLKHALEKMSSPLLRDLMCYLKELMKDYKNEVKEVLATDKQLATEIEYDIKKFEQEQRELADIHRKEDRSVVPREKLLHVSYAVTGSKNISIHSEIASTNSGDSARCSNSAQDSAGVHNSGGVEKAKNTTNCKVAHVNLERLSASSVSKTNLSIRMPVVSLPRIDLGNHEATVCNLAKTVDELILKEEPLKCGRELQLEPDILQTPMQQDAVSRKNRLRAISTPHTAISNISFMSTDTMLIPSNSLSPIPCDEDRLELINTTKTIVHVNTLDQLRLGAKKQWAVKPSNRCLSLQVETIDEQ